MLLFGRFDYTARRILDRTHLRFFTRKTARRFVKENGFTILEERLTVMPLELVFGWSTDSLLGKTVNRLLAGLTALMPDSSAIKSCSWRVRMAKSQLPLYRPSRRSRL